MRCPYSAALPLIVALASCGPTLSEPHDVNLAADWGHTQPQPESGRSDRAIVSDAATTVDAPGIGGDQRGAKTEGASSHVKPTKAKDHDGQARIAALGPHVWIRPKPTAEGLAMGKMRRGTSIRLKSPTPVAGAGCARGWHEVEPRGFVCLNSHTTLDLTDPYYIALNDVAPSFGVVWPYRYAHSRGAPMYSRVPTPSEWRQAEAGMGAPGTYADLGEWAKGHEEMIVEKHAIEATDPVPWYFAGGKRQIGDLTRDRNRLVWKVIPNGSMLSYAKAFEMHGRVWLVATDLTIVPADRVQHMRRSTFRGAEIGTETQLPLAWNRGNEPAPLYRKEGGGYVKTGETMAPKTRVMVTGKRRGLFIKGWYPLRERPDVYVNAGGSITVTFARDKLPNAIKPGQKWIDASISHGTMTAYQGLTPLYATLFSPGKGGQPVPGNDHTVFATTETGYFYYEWKEWVATMSNEKGDPTVLWFSDVPHVQYVKAPLAQHVAYWHEDYGNPKSAECLNMSPLDGRWFFGFTDPPVPPEWGAVGANFGDSTAIMINGF